MFLYNYEVRDKLRMMFYYTLHLLLIRIFVKTISVTIIKGE